MPSEGVEAANYQSFSVLVIACGALAGEITALKKLNGWAHIELQCLDAELHNHPELIPDKLAEKIDQAKGLFQTIIVGYSDCGTGGLLDKMLREKGIERFPGAHCYELFSGSKEMQELSDEEPGSFYLTDFLVQHFNRLVVKGLKLEERPEMRDIVFANYKRVVYLSQKSDQKLLGSAKNIAAYLQLDFIHRHTGWGGLETTLRLVEV